MDKVKASTGIPPQSSQRHLLSSILFQHMKVTYLCSQAKLISPYKPLFLNPENGTTIHSVYLKIQYRLSNVGEDRESRPHGQKLDDNSKQLLLK